MEKLSKKIKIKTTLELISGLHIGDTKESVEIGGIDIPIIKIAISGKKADSRPYVPGSSLKGKIRCLLEQISGAAKIGGNDEVNNLFGFSEKEKPSKLIVRDSYLTKESVELLQKCDNLDMPYTESKTENVIDRVKGTSVHPRHIERVPAGVTFDVEFIINVWDNDNKDEMIALLEKGMNALENDYLGGSGTRGYGQVKFGEMTETEISEETNWK